MDASGFDRSYASRYYTKRTGLHIKAIKTTLLVDTNSIAVRDLHLTTTRKHDTQIAPQLLGRNKMETISGDKGYDDQKLRDMLRRRGVRPLIKHREFKPCDRAANARMDKKLYGQRNMAETANSVIKRRYGDHVRSRKCIVYNIERAIKSLVLRFGLSCKKVFYKATYSYYTY